MSLYLVSGKVCQPSDTIWLKPHCVCVVLVVVTVVVNQQAPTWAGNRTD